jgi:hypothetical protein
MNVNDFSYFKNFRILREYLGSSGHEDISSFRVPGENKIHFHHIFH